MSTGVPSPSRTPAGSSAVPGAATPADGREPTPASTPTRSCRAARARRRAAVALGALAAAERQGDPLGDRRRRRARRAHELAADSAHAQPHRPDLGDPVRTAWQVAYVGHAMLHDPLHLFDANVFYPHPLSLAFSDSLLGYGPGRLLRIGHRRRARPLQPAVPVRLVAVLRRRLPAGARARPAQARRGRRRGRRFAYAPYRVTEAGHLHVISSGGIALALFLLLRGYRRGSLGLVIAGWLVSAWQISLGFTLGLQFSYLLAVLAVIAAVYWLRAGRPALPRKLAAITCLGILVVGAVGDLRGAPVPEDLPRLPDRQAHDQEVKVYSAGPAAWLSASSENRVWGDLTAGARAHVHSKNEQVLFPGGLILLLALIGLATPLHTTIAHRAGRWGSRLRGACAGPGAHGLRLSLPAAVQLRPRLSACACPGGCSRSRRSSYALLAAAGAAACRRRLTCAWGSRGALSTACPRSSAVRSSSACRRLAPGTCHSRRAAAGGERRSACRTVSWTCRPTEQPPTDSGQYFPTNGFKILIGNSTFDIPPSTTCAAD